MPSNNASINDVVDVLLHISKQLNVATGFNSQYEQDNKEQEKEKAEEAVQPTLSSNEKARYKSIARQFESVLGISSLNETLKSLNSTLTDREKNNKEAERSSHIARHRSSATKAAVNQSTSSPGMLSGINNWMKTLGLGALLSLVGGIGAITSSMMKVGPLYGILQNVSKYTSLIGLKGIVVAVSSFMKLLLTPFEIVTKLVTGKSLERLIERGSLKMLGKANFRQASKLLSFLGKGLKFLKPVPILGSLISFYFAWDRFKKGDITGGVIEVISGVASLVPGVGTALSIGLDMINMYRDLSGKSEDEVKTQTTPKTWLRDKMNSLGDFISENCYNWPVIGSLIRAYEHFKSENWLDGINSLAHSIPVLGFITDFFVKEKDSRTGKTLESTTFADVVKKAWDKSVRLFTKGIPIIGDLLESVGHFSKGLFKDGLEALEGIIPGIGNVINFLTPSPETQQQLKTLTAAAGAGIKSFASWTLEKLGLGWLLDDTSDLFNVENGKLVLSFIKDKLSELYGKIKDFFTSMVSSAGDILKSLMGSDGNMSMQFINVLTTIKPSIDKASRELQLTFTSSLKEQLNALSQIEAVLYMQKDILDDSRLLLREIVANTRNNIRPSSLTSSYGETTSVAREERSFTRHSYINDVRSMNAVVRESLA